MSTVRFTRSAQDDLLEIWLLIAQDSATSADNILNMIAHEAELLSQQPFMGRARPELGSGIRSWATASPYILFYTVVNGAVVVLRVLHHARDIRQLKLV